MRRALVPAFLLVLGALVLGATVFREQLVHAATTPFQQVVVTNTPTNPVPVQQAGTSSVSGTVKIDSAGNTVSLNSTDGGHLADTATHLANIDAATGGTVSGLCNKFGDVDNDGARHTLCSTSGSWDISTIVAAGMDDDMELQFYLDDTQELALAGDGLDGTSVYQLNLPRPLRANKLEVFCLNFVQNCKFSVSVLGTSN